MQKTCNRDSYALSPRKSTVPNLELFFGLQSKTNQKINTLKSSILKIENVRHDYALQDHDQPKVLYIKTHWKLALCILLAPMLHACNLLFCLLKAIKMIAIPCIMIIAVFHSLCLSAQTPRKDSGVNGLHKIIPLKVGDTVPDELWDVTIQVINPSTQNKTSTLADYKGQKLLVLDFWNTWCKSCIKLFPKIDSLNVEFQGKLKIVPVSNDPSQKVLPWMQKLGIILKSTNVLGDNDITGIGAYFPRKILPHVVIIADNKVRAITYPEYINSKNLNDMMNGRDVLIKMKYDDLNFNPRFPLFINDLNTPENNFISRSLL